VKIDLHALGFGEMTGLFYNEYPPATYCLRSMTFGRLAGAEITQNLGKPQGEIGGQSIQQEVESKRSDSVMLMEKDLLIDEGKSVQA
jgi:hypothetical protein